jgi:hypothetical protein
MFPREQGLSHAAMFSKEKEFLLFENMIEIKV